MLYLAGSILQICLQSLQKLDSVTLALFNNAWVVVGKEVGIPAEGTRHVACICVRVCVRGSSQGKKKHSWSVSFYKHDYLFQHSQHG